MDKPGRFFNPEQDIDKHRNSLPHWQQNQVWCFVTWRLADSLPGPLLQQWKTERDFWLRNHPPPWDRETEALYHRRFSRQMDQWLDQGIGSCFLRSAELAVLVAGTLRHSDREQYLLRDFVVMPNHVHVLFLPLGDHSLASILKLWKGVSSRQINRIRGSAGPVWQEDYWDRLIRNEAHFERAVSYIRENPVKAGLKEGEFLLTRDRRGDTLVPLLSSGAWSREKTAEFFGRMTRALKALAFDQVNPLSRGTGVPPLRSHPSVSTTGQWSEPVTSERISAPLIRSFRASETPK